MNNKIRQHLIAYNTAKGWGVTDKDLMETVTESGEIYTKKIGTHRWYDDEFRVIKLDGLLIGYNGFYFTGDNGMQDMDLNYDINTVVEVKAKEIVTTIYEPIKQ